LDANGVFILDYWAPMAYSVPVSKKFIAVAETELFVR